MSRYLSVFFLLIILSCLIKCSGNINLIDKVKQKQLSPIVLYIQEDKPYSKASYLIHGNQRKLSNLFADESGLKAARYILETVFTELSINEKLSQNLIDSIIIKNKLNKDSNQIIITDPEVSNFIKVRRDDSKTYWEIISGIYSINPKPMSVVIINIEHIVYPSFFGTFYSKMKVSCRVLDLSHGFFNVETIYEKSFDSKRLSVHSRNFYEDYTELYNKFLKHTLIKIGNEVLGFSE